MTLIEVVVAISILAVLATASLGVYISGINASTAHQRRDVAVTIASQELEKISTVLPSALYNGRSSADVQNLRAANLGIPGVNQMYVASGAAGTISVPMTGVRELSGTKYDITALIGTCFQDKTGGTCTASAGTPPTQPSTVPANKTLLSRVVVVVRWSAGSGCKPTACYYQASTLVDMNNDLRWNFHG